MAKLVAALFSLLLLFLLVLAAVDGSLIRTTTTTTTVSSEDEEDSKMMTEGTCTQAPHGRELGECIDYVKEAASGSRPDWNDVTACCRQIGNVDKDCVCAALKKVLKKSQKHGQFEEEDVSKMTRRAQNIPNICRMGPQGCDWTSVGMF